MEKTRMNEVNEIETVAVPQNTATEKGEGLDEHAYEPEGRDADDGEAQTLPPLAPLSDSAPSSGDADDEEDVIPSVSNDREDDEGRRARRKELFEMLSLYPDIRLSEIPGEVWESPLPLAPAYALYCRRCERDRAIAENENRRNRERSPGGITPMTENYFSPDEVRRMTRNEVRQHYDAILHSMTKWR